MEDIRDDASQGLCESVCFDGYAEEGSGYLTTYRRVKVDKGSKVGILTVRIIIGFKEKVNNLLKLVFDSTETRRDEFFRVQLKMRLRKLRDVT